MMNPTRHSFVLLTALPLLAGAGVLPVRSAERDTSDLPLKIERVPGSSRPVHGLRGEELVSVYVVMADPPVIEALRARGPMTDEERVAFGQRHLAMLAARHDVAAGQVRGLGGRIEADLKRTVNALQVRIGRDRLDRVSQLPGVIRVEPVPYFERSLASAVPFVGADQLWNAAGVAATGKGVRIGVVDTGIDYTHADFGGPGDPQVYKDNDRTIVEPDTFPTAKVVGGYDFAGDDYTGENAPSPDPDPLDCSREQAQYIAGGHGSHVAGIAAGNGVKTDGTPYDGPYEASLTPSLFKVSPGVAPEASLYALKVFGCDGGTNLVAQALEWAVDPNDDGDLSDRLDIVNMSLGGAYGLGTKTDADQVRNVTEAGTLLVIAAGNDGDAFFVTGEPATNTEALSVAANTDQVTFLSMTVESPPSVAGDVPCVEGSFTQSLAESGVVDGQLVATQPSGACTDLVNASQLAGKIALIDRGDCYFADKVGRAEAAGALAVVVANNSPEDPFSMGGTGAQAAIPGVMISQADGSTLRAALSQNVLVTLDAANVFQSSVDADQIAGFSSRGPRASDGLLKPDVAAPGVAIDSAGVASGNQPRQNQGTSMACPMVAGAAALLRQVHPQRGPLDIKTMLMNTTAPLADADDNPTPVSLAGAGRIRVDTAAQRDVLVAAASPPGAVSVSFGAIVTFEPQTATKEVVVTNLGSENRTFNVSVAPTYALTGADVTVSPASVDVAGGETATVQVSLTVTPAELPFEQPDPHTPSEFDFGQGQVYARQFVNEAGGHILFSEPGTSPSEALRVPYHAIVRAADRRAANVARRCVTEPLAEIQIPIEGEMTHREPVTSAFELAATSPADPTATYEERVADLIAVGVATNTATAASFGESSVYFAIVIAGEWTTPARGPLSVVGVFMDTDEDGVEDYVVFAEPLSRDFFADVLAVTTYDLNSGQPVSRRFLNLLPRDELNTEPFNNSVVVLPVSLGETNLTESDASFQFQAFTQQLQVPQIPDQTDWLTYDPANPAIDTAVGGSDGVPFYPNPDSVVVQVNAEEGEPLPRVLLLHHTNERGKRMEVVDLAQIETTQPTDLQVEQSIPDEAAAGGSASVKWTVRNAGDATAFDVELTATVEQANAFGLTGTSAGSCEVDEQIRCALGDMPPGATITVEATVEANQQDVSVEATVSDGLSCETDASNNSESGMIAVVGPGSDAGVPQDGGASADPAALIDQFEPGGGCGCRTSGSNRDRHALALIGLGLLGWVMGRRR